MVFLMGQVEWHVEWPVSLLIAALRGLCEKRAVTSFYLVGALGMICMIYKEKNPLLRFPLLCGFFHFFIHPSGPWLEAPRWVKASYRGNGYDSGLGGVEFGSG